MNKFFKTVFVLDGTALAGYFGLKAYKRINSIVKLSKSLPEFLNNVYGEKPTVNMNKTLNSLGIRVGFSQEILDKHTDIESTVREYVEDFYPELGKGSLDIEIQLKGAEADECCCEDGDCSEGDCCSEPEPEADTKEEK